MKYSIKDNEVVLIPECEMDIYKIGVLHNKYGGRMTVEADTDNVDKKIKEYGIDCNIVLDFMMLRANNGN